MTAEPYGNEPPLAGIEISPARAVCHPSAVIRVWVVAQSMVAWGLERLVETTAPRMELAGSSRSVSEMVASLAGRPCDVLLAALNEPEEFAELASFQESLRMNVLVVSGSQDTALLDGAVLAGARGIVRTTEAPAVLLKAIEKVHVGELWIDRGATSRIFLEMARQKAARVHDPATTKIATLTPRERQTIAAVAGDAAAPAKVIAERLCISEHTLRNHLTSIYSKLEVSNRLDLYAFATRHRLVENPARR